jgi:hypothetical protein
VLIQSMERSQRLGLELTLRSRPLAALMAGSLCLDMIISGTKPQITERT